MSRGNARANPRAKVLSYNPLATTTLNRGDGVKILVLGGVERAPFLGVYTSHIVYALNECSKVYIVVDHTSLVASLSCY